MRRIIYIAFYFVCQVELQKHIQMSPAPVVPIALAATLGALFYVDKQYKNMDAEDAKFKTKKKMRCGLMGAAVVLCLAMVFNMISSKRAKSSFENRVAHAASTLRSSMNFAEGKPSASDDFSARVSKAAADLRKQIASSSAERQPMASSDLAAKASAEISQFIADNSHA